MRRFFDRSCVVLSQSNTRKVSACLHNLSCAANLRPCTGLKAAEQILRKTPNHADTQAMKALIISHQGQQSEAFALAKIALGNNMKSHVCWHVYGLLYRADKNYDESIKAYKFALKLDPESVPIQRDLAQLQIQMRDYAGYIDSRKNMLQQKPGLRQNWTALAIAHHLAGNLAEAENILTTYEDTLKQTPPKADIEHWEAVLYKNAIIAETGQYEKALEHLEAMGRRSPDVLAVMEMRADYLLKLGRMAEAEKAYGALLHRNPDESAHYDTLLSLKNLDGENTDAITAFFQSWAAKFPRSDLPRRKPLDCLDGEAFRHAADAYLKGMLLKGVPATFANVKLLYADRSKHAIVQDLVEGYIAGGIETQLKGFPNGDAASHDLSQFRASIFYFLAQHYCHSVGRDLTKSFKYIDQALEIVPDSVDFHQTKARLLKYAGALPAAAAMQEKARSLDERDRAINTKCAKYQLRNDWNEQALTTMSKFTRNEAAGGPLGDLHDMQCVWYLTEDGKSYLRQHKLGLALKRFHAVQEIFETWQEDQFDFHNFSLRRGMIRVYIDTLRWENHLRDHPYYRQAAISAVSCYILLCDHPALAHGPLINGLNGIDEESPDNAAERKKALKKAKKEQQKLERAEAEKRESLKTSKASTKGADGESKKEDSDPLGKTLMETKAPLQDAMKFLSPLLNLHPQCLHAQSLGFEVFSRRGKSVYNLSSSLFA